MDLTRIKFIKKNNLQDLHNNYNFNILIYYLIISNKFSIV